MTQLACGIGSLLLFFTVSQVLHRRERKRCRAAVLAAAGEAFRKGYELGLDDVMDDVEHALGLELAEKVAVHGICRMNKRTEAN